MNLQRKTRKNIVRGRVGSLLPILFLAVTLLCGCGKTVVWTTEYMGGRIMTIGDLPASETELEIYYLDLVQKYKSALGEDVLTRAGNEELSASIKNNALALLTKIKVLNLMASDYGIELTAADEERIETAAGTLIASMDDETAEVLHLREESAAALFREYLTAQRVYEAILSGVDTEVSDDEARSVQAQSILIKTYRLDGDGNRVAYSEAETAAARQKAEEILQEIRDGIANWTGVTFETYMARYSEGTTQTVTVSRDDEDAAFAEAVFAMDVGTISDVIKTDEGYRIIKCISGYDRDQMEQNKVSIVKARQESAYENAYNSFAGTVEHHIDEKAVNNLPLDTLEKLEILPFTQIYENYFE